MWITLPEQNTVSWEEKPPGSEIHESMLYKMGSQRANRLCYLCLQHKLLERFHASKRDVENGKGFRRVVQKNLTDLGPGELAFECTELEVFDIFYLI